MGVWRMHAYFYMQTMKRTSIKAGEAKGVECDWATFKAMDLDLDLGEWEAIAFESWEDIVFEDLDI